MSEQPSPDTQDHLDTAEIDADETESSPSEYGGPKGREPTRYGDWEKNGRCIDF